MRLKHLTSRYRVGLARSSSAQSRETVERTRASSRAWSDFRFRFRSAKPISSVGWLAGSASADVGERVAASAAATARLKFLITLSLLADTGAGSHKPERAIEFERASSASARRCDKLTKVTGD